MMYEYQLLPFDDLDFFFRFVWYRFEELLLLLLRGTVAFAATSTTIAVPDAAVS